MSAPSAPSARRWIGIDVALVAFDAPILTLVAMDVPLVPRAAFVILAMSIVAALGGYRHRLSLQTAHELPRLVVAVAAAASLVGAIRLSSSVGAELLLDAVLPAIAAVTAVRFTFSVGLRARRTRGHDTHATVVVGAGIVGQRIVKHLFEHPEYGLVPVGFVDDAANAPYRLPVLGRVEDLPQVVERFEVKQVIVAFGVTGDGPLVGAMRSCDHQNIEFWAVPRFFEMGLSGGGYADEIWGLPLMRLRRPALRTAQWRLKRVFDTVVAGVALLIFAPVLLAITLGVQMTSPGPVFFRQRRIGQRGVPFDVLKFRSMEVNDDESTTWNVTDDARVTRIGRILRPTSLDELPQLLNVLRGDMSLVGPRPERPFFVEEFTRQFPRYNDRHRVPVGITGLAQVNGLRGDTSIEERSVFDNYYIENWSLWNDIIILFRTVLTMGRPPKSVRISTGR